MRIRRKAEGGRRNEALSRIASACAPFRLPASAFTLMEMMVALAVAAVLMLSLWGLLGTYAKLFTTGQTMAVHAQVVRGVFQQLTDDLHSAIQDTADSPGGAAARRFGLFGSAHALQIDILQPPHLRPDTAVTHPLDQLDQSRSGPALELRTVSYSFQGFAASDSSQSGAQTGLLRREFDWETPLLPSNLPSPQPADASGPTSSPAALPADGSDTSAQSGSAWPSGATASPDSGSVPSELSGLQQLAIDPNDDSVTWIPEVVALEFRYFDGSSWTSSWSSIDRKSVPVAVEVVMQLAPAAAADASQPVPVQPIADDGTGMGQATLDNQASTPSGPICHLVIHLPAAKLSPVATPFADDDNNNNPPTDTSSGDNSLLAGAGAGTGMVDLANPWAEVGPDGTVQDQISLQDLNTIIGASPFPTVDASTQPQGSVQPGAPPVLGDQWMRVLP